MAFNNRVRLPMKITRAQFPEERVSFRKANGEVKTLSVVIRKTYQGETDYFPEAWHQRLKIALGHDNITYEGEKYVGQIAQDGDYNIEWPDFLDYPTSKAAFQVQVTPFDATNANCQTCEEAAQVVLEDDTFPDPLEDGQSYNLNISDNDSICCFPAVFSVSSYNSDYISGYGINQETGVLSINMKTPLVSANNLLLLTYRVTCPNGGYDEANVYGNIDGSEEGCLAPTDLSQGALSYNSVLYNWTAPASIPALGYRFYVERADNPGVHVFDSSTTGTFGSATGLDPDTDYVFFVYSVCSDEQQSNVVSSAFTTIANTETCGQYKLTLEPGIPPKFVHYRDCSYTMQAIMVYAEAFICAHQADPCTPSFIEFIPGLTVECLGTLC